MHMIIHISNIHILSNRNFIFVKKQYTNYLLNFFFIFPMYMYIWLEIIQEKENIDVFYTYKYNCKYLCIFLYEKLFIRYKSLYSL